MNENAVVGEMGAVEDEAQGLSQMARVVNVFVAPAATFRDILRCTSWWLPFVLMTVAALGVTAAVQQKVGWEQVVQTQIRITPSMQSQMSGLEPAAQGQRSPRRDPRARLPPRRFRGPGARASHRRPPRRAPQRR